MSFNDLVNQAYERGRAPYKQAVEAIRQAARGNDVINEIEQNRKNAKSVDDDLTL